MPKLKKLAEEVAGVTGVAPERNKDNNYLLQSATPPDGKAPKAQKSKPITLEQVSEHYYKLLDDGINPTIRAIYESLDNHGSYTTICEMVAIVKAEHQKAINISLDQSTNRLEFVEVLMRDVCDLVYGSKVELFDNKIRILQKTLAENCERASEDQKTLCEAIDKLNESLTQSHQALDQAIAEKDALVAKNAELLNTIAELKNELKETKTQLKQCKDIQNLLNKLSSDPNFAKDALKEAKNQ